MLVVFQNIHWCVTSAVIMLSAVENVWFWHFLCLKLAPQSDGSSCKYANFCMLCFFLLNKYDYCQNCARLILLMQSAACVYLLSSNFKFNRMRGWFTQIFFPPFLPSFFFFASIRKPIWQETLMDFVRIAFDFNILIGLVCCGESICRVMRNIEFDASVHTFSRWSMEFCQCIVCH